MFNIQEKVMAMRMNGRKKGFTLIELLVVISVIALLLAVLLPALSAVKRRAKYITCAANQGQIVKSVRVYAMDNDDMLAGNWENNDPNPATQRTWVIPVMWWKTMVDKMLPYWADGLDVVLCPGNNDRDRFKVPDNVATLDGVAYWSASYLYLPGLYDPQKDPSCTARWEDANPKAARLRFGRNRGDFLIVADYNIYAKGENWGNVNHPNRGSKFGSQETSSGDAGLDDILQAIEGSNRGHVDGSVSRVGPDSMGTDGQSVLTSHGEQGRYSHTGDGNRPYFF